MLLFRPRQGVTDIGVQGTNIIERAFQLAENCGSVEEVKRKLMQEGYLSVHAHLGGRQIRSEIVNRLDPERVADRKTARV
jgi:hypothetical protein